MQRYTRTVGIGLNHQFLNHWFIAMSKPMLAVWFRDFKVRLQTEPKNSIKFIGWESDPLIATYIYVYHTTHVV